MLTKPTFLAMASLKSRLGTLLFALFLLFFLGTPKMNAQVASYNFSSSIGTYTPILGNAFAVYPWDDASSSLVPIQFPFTYNGIVYNYVYIDCNGFISFGGDPGNNWYACGLQGSPPNSIAGIGTDLVSGLSTSTIQYATTGTTPNRQFVVQYSDCDHYNANNVDDWNFQIILYETTNTIQVVYGSCTEVIAQGPNLCSIDPTNAGNVGLLGNSTADFNIRSVITGSNTWATSTAGTAITDVCEMATGNVPNYGLTYTWSITPVTMSYVSSTTNFLNTTQSDPRSSTSNQLLQIQVVTQGTLSPLNVTSLDLSTTGSTNAALDLANATVYYTGNSNVFANTTQFGSVVVNPNGAYTVNGLATLNPGVNYFWITYDVTANAGMGDTLRGCCTQITGSGTMGNQIPTVTCPAGYQIIPQQMVYNSSTVFFMNNATTDDRSSVNNNIMLLQISTSNSYLPITLTSIDLSTIGSTNAGLDIANAKVYSTGNNLSFLTNTQFGSTVLNPNGTYTVNGSVTLLPGMNYFWITYDITPNAVYNDTLRGCCMHITGSGSMGTQVPTNFCPTGYQTITPPMVYSSSTTTFLNTTQGDARNSTMNTILQIQVVADNTYLPINITNISLNTSGSTNAGTDIANAKVYFTGTSNAFSSATQFGSTVISPNGAYSVTGSVALAAGINYFWVTYDITNTATFNDTLRGCCTQITGDGTMGTVTPTVSCPIGYQTIIPVSGTWVPVSSLAPHPNGGVMILMTDGTVMCKTASGGSDSYGNLWDRLTPDIHGSYTNGTWSIVAPMINTRLFFSTQVLKDGRLYVAGGEYGSGEAYSEVYNPVTNTWTACPYTGHTFVDANSQMLPDGKILQACEWDNITFIYDPISNSYTPGPTPFGQVDESSWIKLPDSSILFVDMPTQNSERYIPSLNQWVTDGIVPVTLYDPYGEESGPAFLLPDGRGFFLGALPFTALYTPSGNNNHGTWAAGPPIPNSMACPDAAGAMMANGKVLFAASYAPYSSNHFPAPTFFYEYNYLNNNITQILAPGGGYTLNNSCYVTNMLDLPDGNVLYSVQQDANSQQYYVYEPNGAQVANGKPTIGTIMQTTCDSFSVTGTLFNGISEGAAYGDDWQMASNYPIVRLTRGGNVYYAKTFNWNRTGVRTGSLPDTTQFTLPAGLPHGIYYLVVIANGIASDSVQFIPFPLLSSNQNPPAICTNTLFTYTPTSYNNGATFTWTRAAVTGISNAAITIPQTSNPNEVLINTTGSPISVVYVYTLTVNGCSDTALVTVIVNPNTIALNGPNTDCSGSLITLTVNNASSYLWSDNSTIASLTIAPTTNTTYTVTATNSYGCSKTLSQAVTVYALPTVSFSGLPDSVCTSAGNAALLGNPNGGVFVGSGMNGTNFQPATASLGLDTIRYSYTDLNGCANTFYQLVYVDICTGIYENPYTYKPLMVYPNPTSGKAVIVFISNRESANTIRLLDVTGRVVLQDTRTAAMGINQYLMNLSEVAKGVYLITLQNADGMKQSKLVVE